MVPKLNLQSEVNSEKNQPEFWSSSFPREVISFCLLVWFGFPFHVFNVNKGYACINVYRRLLR